MKLKILLFVITLLIPLSIKALFIENQCTMVIYITIKAKPEFPQKCQKIVLSLHPGRNKEIPFNPHTQTICFRPVGYQIATPSQELPGNGRITICLEQQLESRINFNLYLETSTLISTYHFVLSAWPEPIPPEHADNARYGTFCAQIIEHVNLDQQQSQLLFQEYGIQTTAHTCAAIRISTSYVNQNNGEETKRIENIIDYESSSSSSSSDASEDEEDCIQDTQDRNYHRNRARGSSHKHRPRTSRGTHSDCPACFVQGSCPQCFSCSRRCPQCPPTCNPGIPGGCCYCQSHH